MASQPLNELVLGASSAAEELSYIALDDISKILIDGRPLDFRLIGGQMVSLHVQRWRLGPEMYRETKDADVGVLPITVKSTDLLEQIRSLGYEQIEGNRFIKPVSDLLSGHASESRESVIDILVPAFTRRARNNLRVGEELVTTEVLGLAEPFLCDPVVVTLKVTRMKGELLEIRVSLPDETSALALKAFAWQLRSDAKDAIDIWRMLEVGLAAGITFADFNSESRLRAAQIICDSFSNPTGMAMAKVREGMRISQAEARVLHTRIRALMKRVLG